VNLFIIFWDRFDILVPPLFFSYLFHSLFTTYDIGNIVCIWEREALSECLISSMWKRFGSASCRVHRFCVLFPFDLRRSKEWNRVSELLSLLNFAGHFIFVWYISIENKWCCINWCLECALCRSHWRSELWSVLDAHCLNFFPRYWISRSILSEKFRVGHSWVIKCNMIVHWAIKIFSICNMSLFIIFWTFNIEIWYPTKLSINVSIFCHSWIIRHSSSFYLIHFIRIKFSFWLH